MMAFAKGMLVSLTLALSIGPGLALQFQASVQRGFKAGCAVISGRYLSDLTLLCLSYIGILQVLTNVHNRYIIGIIGGVALVGFGMSFCLKRTKTSLETSNISTPKKQLSLFSYFFTSLTINTMNPFVCVFWIGLVAIAGGTFGIHSISMINFFMGLVFTAIGFDVLKCYLFSKITLAMNASFLGWINRITGITLLAAGIAVILKTTLH
jgi:threonine/homoserine/homoserine lactone efflux protein